MARPSKRRTPTRRVSLEMADGQPQGSIPLRLSVSKAGLGLELVEPIALGFMEVEQLSMALMGLTYPLDLSGGVARFRHRRGTLERFSLAAPREKVVSAIAPRLRGILGTGTPSLSLLDVQGGVTLGLVDGEKALAFDLLWAPSEADARWVVCGARALGIEGPALAVALRAVDAIAGAAAARAGSLVTFANAAALISRHAMPAIGARAPEARSVRFGPLETDAARLRIACDHAFAPPLLAPHVVHQLELGRIAEQADAALAEGRSDDARAAYLALFERSPRDAALARRLADLDRAAGGRAEAALSTLLETMPAVEAGFVAAELFTAVGNVEAALLAYRQTAEREAYAPLAALALLRASALLRGTDDRVALLDQAVGRAPALAATRWARFGARLALGDATGALADAEHLEAAARGAQRRHEVWRRAADALLAHGHHAKAITLYERALRYVPEHPGSLTGLARGLLAAGRTGRALTVMVRAVELAEAKGEPAHESVLALARALAESTSDYSHAVARLRTIPPGHPESLDARGLEGRYRAALGDVAGASIAYAALRDAIAESAPADTEQAVKWLIEAARFERETQRDVHAASRHLGAALRLAPRHAQVLALFRQVSDESARPRRKPAQTRERDEQRVDELLDRARANPADDVLVLELADTLMRLDRDLEAFSLLSARLEDATGPARGELIARQKSMLGRLAESARRDGRADEAALYRDALVKVERVS
jgi:tetratricopeptide (TPR) repeat protein